MYGYIYKTTNLINGKIYIGQHKAQKFSLKYIGSGKLLQQAKKKFGRENFKLELLEEISTADLMDERERYWIAFYNSLDHRIGYNILRGGQKHFFTGEKHSAKSKQKMSQKALERSKNTDHDVYRTNLNKVCISKDKENRMILKKELPEYLQKGWVKEKYFEQRPKSWSQGLTKETNEYLAKQSERRKLAFTNGSIGCFGRKAEKNVNWKSDEQLIENYLEKGFAEYWKENGKIKTQEHFHIGPKIFDRCMKLAQLKETSEHRKYIYRKNRSK